MTHLSGFPSLGDFTEFFTKNGNKYMLRIKKQCPSCTDYSPQNSPQQSAIAEGFAKVNSVFIVITYCRGDYFLAKYTFSLQFLIFISWQNYHLQTRDTTCMC